MLPTLVILEFTNPKGRFSPWRKALFDWKAYLAQPRLLAMAPNAAISLPYIYMNPVPS
jgi:hypothetical protein